MASFLGISDCGRGYFAKRTHWRSIREVLSRFVPSVRPAVRGRRPCQELLSPTRRLSANRNLQKARDLSRGRHPPVDSFTPAQLLPPTEIKKSRDPSRRPPHTKSRAASFS